VRRLLATTPSGPGAERSAPLTLALGAGPRRPAFGSVASILRRRSRALPPTSEDALLDALREGDERAFLELVARHHALMVRVAQGYVRSRAVAEEVAQETWLGVLNGIEAFEGRSSLKTWIFRILVNRAKTRAEREGRTVPFSALESTEDAEPAVEPSRFRPPSDRHAGQWAAPPTRWDELPEERLLGRETLEHARVAIEALPPRQREVIVLRDVEGWSSGEVCEALELSEGNQRVLLHRARAKVRAELERYLDPEVAA
jgi:RNA polymerase sigma-70 factor (ECF subfamily)